jgi:hypothetical protein
MQHANDKKEIDASFVPFLRRMSRAVGMPPARVYVDPGTENAPNGLVRWGTGSENGLELNVTGTAAVPAVSQSNAHANSTYARDRVAEDACLSRRLPSW